MATAAISKVGTRKGETMTGGDGDDDLYGAGGADRLIGGRGNDMLRSGGIYDELTRTWGPDDLGDTLDGGDGDDYLEGADGDDVLLGGAGKDTLHGNGGADKLYGGDGDDSLNSGAAYDHVTGTYRPDLAGDLLDGGAGNDNLAGNRADDILLGGAGDDTLFGGGGADRLEGGDGNDRLHSGRIHDFSSGATLPDNAGDILLGGNGDDELYGDAGNDTLDGGSGNNKMFGGDGDDTYIVRSEFDYVYDSGGHDKGIIHADWFRPSGNVEEWTWAEGVQRLPNWIAALSPGAPVSRQTGETKVKYYHFAEQPASFFRDQDRKEFMPFNADQRAYMKKMLDYISTVVNIEFRETSDPEHPDTFVIGNNAQEGSAGYAGPNLFMLDHEFDTNLHPTDSNRGVMTFLHELGHVLNLSHPFAEPDAHGHESANDAHLPKSEDHTRYTLMSYTEDPADYRPYYSALDIAALHYLYGPSAQAWGGDTVHVLDPTKSNMVWDGSGNDTLDASALATDLTLDLRPGYWSDLGARTDSIVDAGQVTINFGTVIENLLGGSGNDRLTGNEADNVIRGGAGNDVLNGGAGSDFLDGGAGFDTASYAGSHKGYQVTLGPDSGRVSDAANPAEADTLVGIERLRFDDGWVALDIDGVAGQAYRLYQAAFARTPDDGGLAFWIGAMDRGVGLLEVAANFIGSPEWVGKYGAAPAHAELLDKLYHNILGRAPDQGGFDFWLGHLQSGAVSTVQLLAEFSESAENQEAVIEVIGNGFFYPLG